MVIFATASSLFEGVQVTSSGDPRGPPGEVLFLFGQNGARLTVTTSEILLERGHIFTSAGGP